MKRFVPFFGRRPSPVALMFQARAVLASLGLLALPRFHCGVRALGMMLARTSGPEDQHDDPDHQHDDSPPKIDVDPERGLVLLRIAVRGNSVAADQNAEGGEETTDGKTDVDRCGAAHG